MSFVKIQSDQTNEIQCPPLSMLSQEMHLPWAPQFSTPVLHPGCRTFSDTLTAKKHLVGPKLPNWLCGIYCDKLSETLKTWKANSHLPSRCPTQLRANGQLFQASTYPRLELQDQIKFPRISQLGYFRGHQKHTPSQRQSFHNPTGTWLARFVLCVCHLLSWN